MSRMATNIANKPLPSPESLRNAFEAAIGIQCSPGPLSRSRTPIFVRQHMLTGDAAEKRALTQAARALAHAMECLPQDGPLRMGCEHAASI